MEIEELLHYFNPWWESEVGYPGIPRPYYGALLDEETKSKKVTIITGMRQVGKTTLMKQHIHNLSKQVGSNRIMFLSLEHPGVKDVHIVDVLDAFRKIHRLRREELIFVFLDEITYKDDIARELKIVHDNENVKIFASASSAAGLKDEKAYLTGRNRVIEVSPLTFQEFLVFTGRDAKASERYLLDAYFEDYMKYGGMPEYVLTKDPGIIVELVSDLIKKDIIARHNLRDEKTVSELFLLLCERVGKPMTYNRIANILGIKPDTAKSYIGYFEENCLFYTVPRYTKRLNERIRSPKKVYVADVGIRNVYTGVRDLGAIYENLVFLRMKKDVLGYLYENATEIDFVTKNALVEAKYKSEISEGQKCLLSGYKLEKKVANGVEFFI